MALSLGFLAPAARAGTFPGGTAELQTSGRERGAGVGDWYTAKETASTDRVHRILVEVSQALLDANGGVVNVQVLDAENAGPGDETIGALDPTQFELRFASGAVASPAQTVRSGSPDGTTLTFPITAPGSYQLLSVAGAFPISGDATVDLNNDDNSFRVTVPGNSTLIGSFQGSFSSSRSLPGPFNLNFYFLVGPGQANLRLRNFDLDASATTSLVTYTRPSGTVINGTNSGQAVWNGSAPMLNTGEDVVSVGQSGPYLDAGQWTYSINNIIANNQFALEANSGTQRLVVLDQPVGTADAGNFRITPDGTLPGVIGSPTDHFFSVTNFFSTNDIINFAPSGTSPNYTVQLLDADTGTPLTDTDQDGTAAAGTKRVDTGILLPGQTKNYILRVTPLAGAGPSDTTRITGTSFMDERVGGATTSLFVDKTTQVPAGTNITGGVYGDLNRNSVRDGAEFGLSLTGFFVKLVPAAGGNALRFAEVSSSNGTYTFSNVATGNYTLILDDNNVLTDTAPTVPPGTSGTEAASGVRAVVVGPSGSAGQNFGRFGGVVISGRVFRDDGVGGGTANNGILDGGEIGIPGVIVRAQSTDESVTYDTRTSDASGNYTLATPATGTAIRITETNAAGFRSTGGTAGNSGGAYAIASDATTFTSAAGATYTNLNFGDVPPSIFTNDNTRTAAAGEVVFMPHVFTAGTAGTLNFSLSAVSNPTTGWSNLLYRDLNGDGILQPSEPQITGPLTVAAGQQIAVLTKVFTPLGAPRNSSQTLSIQAALTYANAPAVIESITRTDLVTIAGGSGLILTKSVDRTTARAGDDITYTLFYRNTGNEALGSIVISDTTPTYTVFRSAATGALPAGLTGAVTSFPTVGSAGPLRWTFAGSLPAGASGSVSFVVRLQ